MTSTSTFNQHFASGSNPRVINQTGDHAQAAETINNGPTVDDVLKILNNLKSNPRNVTQEQYSKMIDLLREQGGEIKEIADKIDKNKRYSTWDKIEQISTIIANVITVGSSVAKIFIP